MIAILPEWAYWIETTLIVLAFPLGYGIAIFEEWWRRK